jgi:hypothetical protein
MIEPVLSGTAPPRLLGVDFTSAPRRSKPITVARGRIDAGLLRFDGLDELPSFAAFEALLREPGPWLGAFDFPFGLPRAFAESNALGSTADAVIASLRQHCGNRMGLRRYIDAWGNAQPAGQRLLHRRCDRAMPGISSTSPLQTRYVPVGFMYFEGVSRLVDADLTMPGLRAGDPARVAVEAYPGFLAHALIGRRSYKNTDDADRLIARKDMVEALERGSAPTGLRLKLSHAQREALVGDPAGDRLDAALCLMQAAWASMQPGHGLPPDLDTLEGWIVSAPWPGS